MKATELRIGNYYLFQGVEYKMTPNKLKAIIQTGDYDNIKPIPITKDRLLEFGFEENTSSWTNWDKPNYSKEVRLNKVGRNQPLRYNNTSILYVHQLQNLYFALTGQELMIQE